MIELGLASEREVVAREQIWERLTDLWDRLEQARSFAEAAEQAWQRKRAEAEPELVD